MMQVDNLMYYQKGLCMSVLKTKIVLLMLSTLCFATACSDSKEESSVDAKKEVASQLEPTADDSANMISEGSGTVSQMAADASESVEKMYDDTKDKASELTETSMDKAEELKDTAAEKLKQICIETKKKTGGDPADCE